MPAASSLRRSRFVVAVAVSAVLVISAPFIGYVRSWIRTQFPGEFVRIVGGAMTLLAITAVVTASRRIRERRALRYGAIAAAIAMAVAYSMAEATGNADVDAVQRFHFLEYGLITYLFYRAWRPLDDPAILVLPVLAGLLVGTADEWLQWFIPNRVGEMADVFLNGVALACGLVFSLGADPPSKFTARLQPGSWRRIGRLGAAVVLGLALFFQVVHLGFDVQDDEIGRFKSRYSRSALERLAVQKQEEWRARPLPLVLQRVSREDQYMTEGVTHVQKRNEHLAGNDVAAAWKENRILEKYYSPVLDTPSYVSRTGHRWSPEQRAEVATRASTAGAGYVSSAHPYPIYAWRPGWLWAGALGLAAAVWFGCRARRASGEDGESGDISPQGQRS
jgi:hypothetical protein